MIRLFSSVRKRILALKAQRLPVVIEERDLEETFMRGDGPGGQATNKTSNCVRLLHKPTQIQVKCHATRSLEVNRKKARNLLWDKLDKEINKEKSLKNLEELKKKEKSRQSKRKRDKKKENENNS